MNGVPGSLEGEVVTPLSRSGFNIKGVKGFDGKG